MRNMFNVLWIDDEYEDLIEDYNDMAEEYGIKLTGFESYEELKEEMTNKFHNYQAVVLDGVFKIKKSDINPKDDKALLKSIKFIMNEEKKGRRIDVFCLSGNPPFLKNDNQALRMEEIPVFRKNNFKGFDKNYEEKTIWECIEKKCEQKAQNDIQEKYKEPLTPVSYTHLTLPTKA